ncbi:class I SAM-dependent methyltransferase [Actinoplanes sp. NPDC051494]|uniref:class I SAM-dependent methyltransferase n=1 Tax=Actinoplanes sp. NPDC051494 TaxID=3363907 RepID=UPI00379DF59C
MLALTARGLTTGRAVGLDRWREDDQSGNTPEAVRTAVAPAPLIAGDLRALPLPDAVFDLVTSSVAIHHIGTTDGRAAAVTEAYRVLRPGGRIRIADLLHTGAYADTLRDLGAEDVGVRDLGPRCWYGGPWFATSMVTATKPA